MPIDNQNLSWNATTANTKISTVVGNKNKLCHKKSEIVLYGALPQIG
jgi:hypothetical protein